MDPLSNPTKHKTCLIHSELKAVCAAYICFVMCLTKQHHIQGLINIGTFVEVYCENPKVYRSSALAHPVDVYLIQFVQNLE